ncbi:aminopeptidase P family protein [bacterium]|nr:aminopeptidase P family protein [candidate division CSSED10-310 bacterium]
MTLRMGIRGLGVNPETLSYYDYCCLKQDHSKMTIQSLPGIVSRLRETKDLDEIQCIRTASGIAVNAFRKCLPLIRSDHSEQDIANLLDNTLRSEGADYPAFETMVLSGMRSAYPHAVPTRRKLKKNELVIVDFGAKVAGYHCDVTRMLIIGNATSKQRKIYSIVYDAMCRAMEKMKPGVRAKQLDRIARKYIENAGVEGVFSHPFGHGIGLSIHERPIVDPESDRILEAGMVISFEPGIYLPGWAGIRIEDTILVTDQGPEVLTNLEKDRIFEIKTGG